MSSDNEYNNSDDVDNDDIDQEEESNNIELLNTLKQRFKSLRESELKDAHLFLDRHFFQVANSMQFEKLIGCCTTVNLLTQSFSSSQLDRLSLLDSDRLVVMIASYLWDYTDAIKMLLSHYNYKECLILCSMSEIAHLSHPHLHNHSPKSPTSLSTSQNSSSSSSQQQQQQTIYQKYQNEFESSSAQSSSNIQHSKSTTSDDSDSDKESNEQLEESPTESNKITKCTVRYFPTCYSLLAPNYFTLPVQGGVFPPLYFVEHLIGNSSHSSSLRQDIKQRIGVQEDVHITTHSLLSFLGDLRLGSATGEDLNIYPVGAFSNYLAGEIHNVLSSVHRDQTDDYHPISLVLVDRYLDLVGPCSHSENSFDRIYQSAVIRDTQLPDINIKPVFLNNASQQHSSSTAEISPLHKIFGTINMEGDNDRIWITLATKTLREAIVLLKRRVVDIVAHENINVDVASLSSSAGGAMSPNGLIKLVDLLKSNGLELKYKDDIQALGAVIQTLQCSQHQHWDNLLSLEKILLLSAGYGNSHGDDDEEEEDSLLSQISEIINTPISSSDKSKYRLRDIVSLCLFAFSLVGEKSFSDDDQSKLLDSLQDRILHLEEFEKNDDLYKDLFGDLESVDVSIEIEEEEEEVDNESDDDESKENSKYKKRELNKEKKIRERLNLLLDVMETVSKSRRNLVEFSGLLRGGMSGSTYQSLLSQLVRAMLEQTEQKEIKALERFNPSKLGSLLTKGFGWGRSKRLARVVDNRKIVIYVLGGLTFAELKEIQDIIEKSLRSNQSLSQHQILIGGSCVATSDSIISGILNNLNEKIQQ